MSTAAIAEALVASVNADAARLAAQPATLVPDFVMGDDRRAHVVHRGGSQFALCGVPTRGTAPAKAVPCPTCFAAATERLAAQN